MVTHMRITVLESSTLDISFDLNDEIINILRTECMKVSYLRIALQEEYQKVS